MMRLGCIGLGELGLAIAANLLEAGFPVTGYRRSSLEKFAAIGGTPARSSADVMTNSDVVVTCVSSGDALTEVVFGATGLLKTARTGQVLIDITTAPIAVKEAAREALAAAGAFMLDCPVSGRPDVMRRHQSPVFVSGDPEVAERCRPVFDAISARHLYLGPFGAGSKMKFIANLLLPIHVLAIAEATEIARQAGFTPAQLAQALTGSAAESAQLHIRTPVIAAGPRPGKRPAAGGFHGDLVVIRDFVNSLGCAAPLFETALAQLEAAEAAGHGDQDTALVFTALLRDLGQIRRQSASA